MAPSWKETYKSVIEKTAKSTNLGKKDVEDILDSFFEGMAYFVKLRTMPTFVLKNFFTIGPDIDILKKKTKHALKARNEKNRSRIAAFISSTWKVIKRIEAERKGKYSYALWKRIEARTLKSKYSKVLLGDIFSQIIK